MVQFASNVVSMIIGMIVGMVLSLSPAFAQELCAPYDQVAGILADQYGETPTSAGSIGQTWMQVYANTETGSFSIVVTRPDGVSCLLASGMNYQDIKQEPNV